MPYLAPGSDEAAPSPADAGPATPKPSRSEFAAAASAAAEVAKANKDGKNNNSDASPAETHDVSPPPPATLLSADESARVTSTVAIDQANTATVPDVTITPPATDKTDKAKKQVSRASSTGRQLRLRLLNFLREAKAWILNRDARDLASDRNRKIATTNSNTKE